MNRPARDVFKAACVTVLGAGYGRPAPGTWGSAVGVGAFAALWWLGASVAQRWLVEALVVGVVVVSAIASVRLGVWAVARFESQDPRPFVLDEFAGQLVALLGLPVALGAPPAVLLCVTGGQFVLFRVLDIVKPPPARRLERLPAGWGILLDDLVAGAYANVVGQLVWRASPLASWLAAWVASGPA